MIEDIIEMKGRVQFQLLRADGTEVTWEVDNLVPNNGKGVIAERMKAAPSLAAMTHMAVGTSGTVPAAGDANLGAEVAGSRTALTATVVAGPVITYTASFGPGVGTGALVEAGIFNATPGGVMLCRTTFTVINKAAGDTLNVTWTVTVG